MLHTQWPGAIKPWRVLKTINYEFCKRENLHKLDEGQPVHVDDRGGDRDHHAQQRGEEAEAAANFNLWNRKKDDAKVGTKLNEKHTKQLFR